MKIHQRTDRYYLIRDSILIATLMLVSVAAMTVGAYLYVMP